MAGLTSGGTMTDYNVDPAVLPAVPVLAHTKRALAVLELAVKDADQGDAGARRSLLGERRWRSGVSSCTCQKNPGAAAFRGFDQSDTID